MEKGPKIELPQKTEVETWEDEGGSVGVEEFFESVSESKENLATEIEPSQVYRSWEEIIKQAKAEFPEEIKMILDKKSKNKKLKKKERNLYRSFVNNWFVITFGIKTKKSHQMATESMIKLPPTKEMPIEEELDKEEAKAEEIKKSFGIYNNPKKRALMRSVLSDHRPELPDKLLLLTDKILSGLILEAKEQTEFDTLSSDWFKNKFGTDFKDYKRDKQDQKTKKIGLKRQESRTKRVSPKLQELKDQKTKRMERLHEAIKNLDNGEPAAEFKNETRKVIYYDEKNGQYYLSESGQIEYFGIGDIMSDYAWGIRYVPDGEMIEPAYRTIAKRILANETRRDLEKIHDRELQVMGLADSRYNISLEKLEQLEQAVSPDIIGALAEIEIREFLTRLSLNKNLNFLVLRADAQEDTRDKYDFKIKVKRRVRGINVEPQNIQSVGFQLKTKYDQKTTQTMRYAKGHKRLVEEVIKLTVPSKKIKETVTRWLEAGKPSGGPEKFLSRDLKISILKKSTKELVRISDKEIDKIFSA